MLMVHTAPLIGECILSTYATRRRVCRCRRARVQGRFGHDRDGTWWGHELAFLSDDLTVIVHQGQMRLSPAEAPWFEVRTTLGLRAHGSRPGSRPLA